MKNSLIRIVVGVAIAALLSHFFPSADTSATPVNVAPAKGPSLSTDADAGFMKKMPLGSRGQGSSQPASSLASED